MIEDVFTAVTTALTTGVAPPLTAAQCFLGPEFLRQEDAPPRIVWVPTEERIAAGRKTQTGAVAYAPRALRTREVRIDIHCWGADYPGAETLWSALEQSVHGSLVGAYELDGASWDQVASLIRSGRVLTAHYHFLIPLTDVASTTAVVIQAPLTLDMQAP